MIIAVATKSASIARYFVILGCQVSTVHKRQCSEGIKIFCDAEILTKWDSFKKGMKYSTEHTFFTLFGDPSGVFYEFIERSDGLDPVLRPADPNDLKKIRDEAELKERKLLAKREGFLR